MNKASKKYIFLFTIPNTQG